MVFCAFLLWNRHCCSLIHSLFYLWFSVHFFEPDLLVVSSTVCSVGGCLHCLHMGDVIVSTISVLLGLYITHIAQRLSPSSLLIVCAPLWTLGRTNSGGYNLYIIRVCSSAILSGLMQLWWYYGTCSHKYTTLVCVSCWLSVSDVCDHTNMVVSISYLQWLPSSYILLREPSINVHTILSQLCALAG